MGNIAVDHDLKLSQEDKHFVLARLRNESVPDDKVQHVVLEMFVDLGYRPYDQSPVLDRDEFESLHTCLEFEEFSRRCFEVYLSEPKITSRSHDYALRKRVLRTMLDESGQV